MKRKTQIAEFRPPQQRLPHLTKQQSSTSGETTKLQPTDGNQMTDMINSYLQSASVINNCEEHTDSDMDEIPTDVKQANLLTTERVDLNDFKNKSWDGLTWDSTKQPETNEGPDLDPQTSYGAHSSLNPQRCRVLLDDTPCEDVEENKANNLENVSSDCEIKPPADESVKPPPKKRFRRRMGMCGLRDMRRRFAVEEQACKQTIGGAGGKENGLKNNPVVENKATVLVDDMETTEQVLTIQVHGLQQVIQLPKPDLNEVQNQPVAAITCHDHETKTTISGDEPDSPKTGTDYQNMELTVIPKGLDEDQNPDVGNKETEHFCRVTNETTKCPIGEELSHDSTGHTDRVCKSSKETSECPIVEELSYDSTGVTGQVCKSPKENSEGPTVEELGDGSTVVTGKVSKSSNETTKCPIGEELSHDSTGHTDRVSKSSEGTSEYQIGEKLSHDSTNVTGKVCKSSNESSECPIEVTLDVSEDATETTKCPVSEDMTCASSEVCKGLNESSVEEEVSCVSLGVNSEVNEDFRDTTEFLSAGAADEIFKGPKKGTQEKFTTDKKDINIFTGVNNEVYDDSKDTTECPVVAEVTYGSTGINLEVSKDVIGDPAVEVNSGFIVSTNEPGNVLKEVIGGPAVEVNYGITDTTYENGEVLKEAIGGPTVKAEYDSTDFTDKNCKGSKIVTGGSVLVVSVRSTVMVETLEASIDTAGDPALQGINGSTGTDKTYEDFKDATGGPVLELSAGSTVMDKTLEASKHTPGDPTVGVNNGSTKTTVETLEASKDAAGDPSVDEIYGSRGTDKNSHAAEDPAVDVNNGSTKIHVKTLKASKEVTEGPAVDGSYHSLGITDLPLKGFKEAIEGPASEVRNDSLVIPGETLEVFKNSTGGPAIQVNSGSHLITDETPEASKDAAGDLAVQGSYGSLDTDKTNKGSIETTKCPVLEGSYGSTGTYETLEAFKEASEGPPAEVNYGSTDITVETNKTSKNSTGGPAIHVGLGSTDITVETNEASKNSSEGPAMSGELRAKFITVVISDETLDPSKDAAGDPVLVMSDGSTAKDETLEAFKEATEGPAVEVNYGSSDITVDTNKTFKNFTGGSSIQVSSGSPGITDDTLECSKEAIGGPASEVSSGSIVFTNDICESEIKAIKNPAEGVEEGNYRSTSVTVKVCEDLKEITKMYKHQVDVPEEMSDGSICEHSERKDFPVKAEGVHLNEACENTKDQTKHRGEVEEVSCGSVGVSDEVCGGSVKVSKVVREALTALEESEMETEEPCSLSLNLAATSQQDINTPQLCMSTDPNPEDPVLRDQVMTVNPEAAFPVKSQCEYVKTLWTTTPAVPERPDPGEEGSVNTAESLLDQNICDPMMNPTMAPPAELLQDQFFCSLTSVTDTQLNNVLSMDLEELPFPEVIGNQEAAEDATEFVCGLITELSSLNRTVMAAHREIELIRRGNRPLKALISRSFGPRSA